MFGRTSYNFSPNMFENSWNASFAPLLDNLAFLISSAFAKSRLAGSPSFPPGEFAEALNERIPSNFFLVKENIGVCSES